MELTGIPQLVEIPAPVMTTTFLDFARISAMSCSCWPDPGATFEVGMALLTLFPTTSAGNEPPAQIGITTALEIFNPSVAKQKRSLQHGLNSSHS
jgi:hypothetical protein